MFWMVRNGNVEICSGFRIYAQHKGHQLQGHPKFITQHGFTIAWWLDSSRQRHCGRIDFPESSANKSKKTEIQQSEHLWDSPATKSTINKLFINIPQWCELIHTSLLAQKGSQGQGNHFCWWFHPTCVNVKTWTKMNAVLRTRAWKPERNSSSKGPQFHFLREPVFQDSIWHEDIHGQGNFQGNYQKNFTSIEVVKVEEKYQRKCQFEANSLVLWSFFDHCAYSMYSWRINDKTLSLLGD